MLIKCLLPSRHCAVFQERRHYSRRACVCVLVTYSCLTLCNPMDCSPPGYCVHEVYQARILEWLPPPSLGYLPNPGIEPESPTLEADALTSEPQDNCFTVLYFFTVRFKFFLFTESYYFWYIYHSSIIK